MAGAFQFGIDVLRRRGLKALKGRRVGLLAHPASLGRDGRHSAAVLREALGDGLVALFGPEHGFLGGAGPGEAVPTARHPAWGLPVHSLYGEHRRPTPEMLTDLDVLVLDLQDLAVRCYTFCATLRLALEACAAADVDVMVTDRPVPWPDTCDGPLPDERFASFVAGVPAPFVYGLTPGELVGALQRALDLRGRVEVIPMAGWRRAAAWPAAAHWVSPSPGIRTWATAWCYPITVMFEALAGFDCGRRGSQPFELAGAPGLDAEALARHLNAEELPGLRFEPHWWRAGETLQSGVRLVPFAPEAIRPAASAVALAGVLQEQVGPDRVWAAPGAQPEWFDKLFGTDAVRRGLQAGRHWREIAGAWEPDLRRFEEARAEAQLYE